ncbi:zinc finger matrin-type protein 5 [Takifugu rubripes]|uniref:zinc finger matrin-type protein 5 n=1 Tax=Takifugu rubripes TaxID=31033 RepID=UPI001145DE88|nr:zinc finger matrin-type protein 5 [Takifugu rubripes]
MGKRYFCDYCDRSFQDNMHNRKKHLNGVQHHRAKKAWFDHFKDSSAVLDEEQAKKPCRKFMQKGICDYGPNCRFSHMTEQDIFYLRRQVEEEKRRKEGFEDKLFHERSVEDWLSRREKKRKSAPSTKGDLTTEEDSEEDQSDRDVLLQLLSVHDLPPSLLPPPSGGWKVQENAEWG